MASKTGDLARGAKRQGSWRPVFGFAVAFLAAAGIWIWFFFFVLQGFLTGF